MAQTVDAERSPIIRRKPHNPKRECAAERCELSFRKAFTVLFGCHAHYHRDKRYEFGQKRREIWEILLFFFIIDSYNATIPILRWNMKTYEPSPREHAIEQIEAYIRRNNLKAYDKLPTEREMCQLWNVNRNTLRSALKRLITQGKLCSLWGSGIRIVDKILPDTQIKSYIVNEDEWLIKNKDLDVQQEKKYFVLTEGKKLLQLESTLSCEENNQWSYVYNPKNPVPSHGGESLLWSWDDIGSLKQPPCGWRDDVLSFVSEPLSQDMIVLGSIKVELYVSSDASDTAFSAKLMEIRPDGSAYHVRSGITTLAYRSGADFPRGVYKAGQMVKVEINFWDIGWCFKTGTRLRLDISSSDFPQYSIHSNYPGVWSVQTKTKPAVQTVYSCPGNTSAIIFPIISNK